MPSTRISNRVAHHVLAAALVWVASSTLALADTTAHTLCVAGTPTAFTQNWTNAGQITANDDWSGVPSLTGYLGDIDAGSATGVNPTTLTAAALGAVDVIANQTAPNTLSNGGVAEFDLANDVLAMQGSGTADAPSIVLTLNSAGTLATTLAYTVRDVDGSADNTNQQFNVQYRTGTSSTWTNLPGSYIADASAGPSLTLDTPVSITLPAALNNVGTVQLRFMTTNAAGNDEWLGVDDVVVTPTCQTQKSLTMPLFIAVRPGGVSFNWTISTDTSSNPIADVGFQNVTAFSWLLTRGRIEYSTDAGANWTTYSILNDNISAFLSVSGRLWRFVDTSPADPTTTNSFGNCWHLVSTPGSTSCSGGNVVPDGAPTDISSDKASIFDNAGVGATLARLTPTDTGLTTDGGWVIESQSVPNLFVLSHNRATGNVATLTRGSAAVPAIGQTPTVTVRYTDIYQTDASGAQIAGQGFSKTLTYTVVAETSNALTLGNDIAVNTFTSGNQSGQSVALLSTGNVAVVWQSAGQGGGDTTSSGIYGQLLSSAGAKVGGEFVISNVSTNNDEATPVVAPLATGRYVVAYASNVGGDYNIKFRLIEANGTVGGEFTANSTTAGGQNYPAIVTTTDGNFVVAWNSDNGDIRARKFNTAGAALAGEVLFADGNVAGGYYPSVAALSNGDYALAWVDYVASHVFLKVAGVAGVTDTGIITGGYTPPRVVGLGGGGFVLTSESYDAGTTRYQIEAIRYNNAGAVQTAKFQVNSVSTGNRYAASLAALTGGGFIVGWGADNGDFDLSGVFGRRYNATAVAVDAAEFQINQHRLDDQNYPALAPLAGDLFLASWTEVTGASVSAGTYLGDIEARVLGPASVPDLTVTKVANGVFQRGGTASFTVTVTNSGTGSTTAAYTLSDSMPTGLTVASVTTPAGWDCTASTPTVVSCTRSTALAAAASSTITISVNIAANAPASITNTANVAGGGEVVTSNDSGSATVNLTPLVSIAVAPASVAENGSTDLVYTLTNSPTVATATTVNITTSGTATAGTDYSGGVATAVIPANTATTTITINPTGDTTIEPDETVILTVAAGTGYAVGSPSSASGTIQNDDVALPPTVSKFFVNPSQANTNNTTLNGTARLSIAITNPPGNSTNLSGLAISDTFPAGMEVDATPSPTNTCGGTFAPTAGATSISFSGGGPLSVANQCVISVVVKGTIAGALVNTTGNVSSTEGGAGLTASATLNVYQPPVVTKLFTPANILQNQTSVLRLEIQSPTAGLNLSGVNLTDNFPSGMVVGSPPLISTTNCGGLTVTDNGGGSFQTGDTGVRLNNFLAPAATPCVVQLNVVGQTVGALLNTTDAPTSTNGGTGLAASATLNVAARADLTVTKVANGAFLQGGSASYTVTVTNSGLGPTSGAYTLADPMPTGLTAGLVTSPDPGWNCTASTTTNVSCTRSTVLAAGASSTLNIPVTIAGNAPPSVTNTAAVTGGGEDVTNNNSGSATVSVASINLGINDVSVTEGNSGSSNATFTVSLSTPAGPGGVSFDIATADGTATAGTDYVARSLTGQTIPPGSSAYTFTVQVNGDTTNEANEIFAVNVSNVVGAVVADSRGIGTITNDDPLPSLSINDVTVTEGNSGTVDAVFTVSLSAASGQNVNVDYQTAENTATVSDYADMAGMLAFSPGETTQTVTVSVIGDTTAEIDETYFVNLAGAINATISDNQGLGTITNDDAPNLSINDVSINEGNAGMTSYTFTVSLSVPAGAGGASFDIATADGTATTGTDYVARSLTNQTIPPGSSTYSFTVQVNGDTTNEANEIFVVNVSNVVGAVVFDGRGIGTITNDDPLPSLSINDVTVTEGNSGTVNALFTVSLSAASGQNVNVDYQTAENTATVSDYADMAGMLAFSPGEITQTLTVTVNGDITVENDETYFVNLAGAINATISDNQGLGTISNDDTAGITLVQSGGNTAVTEGGATDSYTLVLTSQPTANVSVALSGTQVSAAPTPVIFTPANWNVAQTVTVTAIDDAIAEGAHSGSVASTVSSSDPVYAGFAVAPVAVTITDNDVPGITVTQSGGTTVATEGGATDSYTVVLTSQPTANVVIALSGTQVTPAPTPLTFTSGNWNVAQTVTVTAIDDAIAEGTHSGSVASTVTSGDSNYNAFPIAAISVSISDNDNAGVTITQTGTTDVTEGGATDTYSAVLTSQPTADVTITPSTTGEVSFSPASRTFTSGNWNVAQSFTVTATDDAIVEGAESATITHTSASGDPNYQGATVASVSAAISDNDSATVQFAPISVSQTEASSPMAFTVTLSAPVQSGVTLTVNSATGTATAADFTAISNGTVTFAANSTTSQTVNVSINNDALDEDDETFSLALSGLTATGNVTLGAGAATATGTILDDDPTPTISVTSPSLDEGNSGTSLMNFVVSLNAVSGRDVTFTRATADGTATVANNDYVALAASVLTIPAGQTSLTIPVTINGDTPYEGNESFALNITGVSNATPVSVSGTGTIVDDDQQPTTTTITGDTPDPTVVGQAYTVSASVVAQTTSPLGTVTISDGSASCTATLTAGTAPDSAISCLLTSTSAGAKTLTASYTPASSAFAASSDTDTHQVNAAATTISVSGPARSRINQATSFSFVLGVTTPGAGTPTGVVTLSSGAASCTATLPATNCSLTFTTLGARTVTASYASDGNFGSSSSSGAGNAQTLVYALSDLSISKTDGVGYYEPGDLLVYSVIVRNLGPDDAANIRVVDTIPAGLTDVVWSCDASGGGVCPASGGAGNLDVVLANVRVGALLNFTFFGNVAGSPLVIANTASIVLPADTTIDDPVLANNSATDTDQIDFTFRDGFENPPVSAPSGSARIPALALARELGDEARVVLSLKDAQGEALRVYARLHDESLQYALARRASNGQLRLEAWRSLPGEPTLSWSARAVATGWVMEAAELR